MTGDYRSRILATILASLLAAPLGAAVARAEGDTVLGLRDGRLLWGAIESHDEQGFDFLRLDNGGRVRLAWNALDPRFEEKLRQRFGYVDLAADEVMISADRLQTVDGQEVVGRILRRTSQLIEVKTARQVVSIPLGRLAGPSTLVRTPALDVYTRDELYQRELAGRRESLDRGGRAGAEAHFALGQYCERILDYEHAAEHYARARDLDPDFRPNDMVGVLARAQRKATAQEQVDRLSEIRRERQRGRFATALALTDAFRELYPESPLFEDLNRLRESVLEAQEDALAREIVRHWHVRSDRLTARAARELGFDAAVAYVEQPLGEEILTTVTEDVRSIDPDVTEARVRELFDARPRGKSRRATYGTATFLLGDERARSGLQRAEDEDESEAATSSADRAREDLEERIRRFLDQQRVAGRSRSSSTGPEPEEVWKSMSNTTRASWLLAYYAEFGGDFEVRNVHFRNCRECGGTGIREVVSMGPAVSGGQRDRTRRYACPVCQHVGIVRRVSYR